MASLFELEGVSNFHLEPEPQLVIPIIPLPYIHISSPWHFGSESKYDRFSGSTYFIRNDNEQIIYKYIVMKVVYKPDELYNRVDGNAGRCWIVTINDNENGKIIKYYIRNWIDIVEHYREKGLEFIYDKNK